MAANKDYSGSREQFGAIPMRAFADSRMKRSHLSVLGVIAHFDRFGRNGSGCYTRQDRISQLANCVSTTVSKCIRDLVEWGYIQASRQENRRRLQYRVVYQNSLDSCSTEQVSHREQLLPGTTSSPEQLPHRANKEILLRSLKDSAKQRQQKQLSEKDSPEGALALHTNAPKRPDHGKEFSEVDDSELWAYRRQMSQWLQDGKPLSDQIISDVTQVFESLFDEDRGDRGLESAFEDLVIKIDCRVNPEES